MGDSTHDIINTESVDNLSPEGGFSPQAEVMNIPIGERPGGNFDSPKPQEQPIAESVTDRQSNERAKTDIRQELSQQVPYEVDNRLDMNPEATARMMAANQKVMEDEK